MLLLAIDTSSPHGSLALAKKYKDSNLPFQLLGERHWSREKSHNELVTMALQGLLEKTQTSIEQIQGILVGAGPGSFTGIRVGLALARTLGYSLNCPVWSANSLRLWAQTDLNLKTPTLVVMNGFRDIVYAAVYQPIDEGKKTQELLAPLAVQAHLLESHLPPGPLHVVGDGWEKFKVLWPRSLWERGQLIKNCFPEARDLFTIFVQSQDNLSQCSWKNIKPLYIRGSEAEEKLRQGLLKPLPKV